MSDLTEYDREIVAAAEAYIKSLGTSVEVGAWLGSQELQDLAEAVQAKREAQRPPCNEAVGIPTVLCGVPAVQELKDHAGLFYRCDEHRIEVREL